jgi:hypothetical protein
MRVTPRMQGNYDDSTHRRHEISSSSDLPNPEHEATGRVPWVNSTIYVNILFFSTRGLGPSSHTKYRVTGYYQVLRLLYSIYYKVDHNPIFWQLYKWFKGTR